MDQLTSIMWSKMNNVEVVLGDSVVFFFFWGGLLDAIGIVTSRKSSNLGFYANVLRYIFLSVVSLTEHSVSQEKLFYAK